MVLVAVFVLIERPISKHQFKEKPFANLRDVDKSCNRFIVKCNRISITAKQQNKQQTITEQARSLILVWLLSTQVPRWQCILNC